MIYLISWYGETAVILSRDCDHILQLIFFFLVKFMDLTRGYRYEFNSTIAPGHCIVLFEQQEDSLVLIRPILLRL